MAERSMADGSMGMAGTMGMADTQLLAWQSMEDTQLLSHGIAWQTLAWRMADTQLLCLADTHMAGFRIRRDREQTKSISILTQ